MAKRTKYTVETGRTGKHWVRSSADGKRTTRTPWATLEDAQQHAREMNGAARLIRSTGHLIKHRRYFYRASNALRFAAKVGGEIRPCDSAKHTCRVDYYRLNDRVVWKPVSMPGHVEIMYETAQEVGYLQYGKAEACRRADFVVWFRPTRKAVRK